MYRNNVRVYSSPPIWKQGFSPHPHLIVVDTFGEGRAGFLPAMKNESLSAMGLMQLSLEEILLPQGMKKITQCRGENNPILRQILGEGGLSN